MRSWPIRAKFRQSSKLVLPDLQSCELSF